ncbi:MAG: hypothetical protein ABIH89_07975 [Elusimicrobiota bacterium]
MSFIHKEMKMLKKYFIAVLITVIAVQTGFTGKTGKTGWMIFRKARSAKFKPITVTPVMAVRGDLSGVFYNPGVLAFNTRQEIFFLSELGLSEDMFGGLVYGHPLKNACIAGGLLYYDAGNIELNWLESGVLKSDNVNAQRDILGIASYGRKINDRLALGVTVKMATSRLVERASSNAFAADVGGLFVLPEKNLSFTGAVQNLGSSSKFVEKANPLPLSAFLGAGYAIEFGEYYMTPGCDLTYLIDEERMVPELGFELGRNPFSVNFGYSFNVAEAKWHIGFTLLKDKYDIAYGYLPGTYLDATHRISMGFGFGPDRAIVSQEEAPKKVTKEPAKKKDKKSEDKDKEKK